MLLVSTRIGSLQEEDACVQKHLEVFDTRVIHALHGGRVDGVLGPRLRGEVREKLDLAQGRGYGDAARCDLTGLVRVDAAAMLNVIDTRFNERINDAVRESVDSDARPDLGARRRPPHAGRRNPTAA